MGKTNKEQIKKEQFNKMLNTLKRILKYQSIDKLRRDCEKEYGLEYEECLEMAYENIKSEASFAVKGIREIK